MMDWTRLQEHVFSLKAPYRGTVPCYGGPKYIIYKMLPVLAGDLAYRGISVSRVLYMRPRASQSPSLASFSSSPSGASTHVPLPLERKGEEGGKEKKGKKKKIRVK